ncbi:hypothetical protein ACF068_14750 [Streptomyces sp. NPDC016309]|uniref:hypothetical protein n=1 Tax=Streptomyces sp. NPDC016309 TaxID=3364965 RepID=UPI0036FB400C
MTDETTRPTGSSGRRTDLADLVRARVDELGVSVRALAARCIDPEPELQPAEERNHGPLWTRGTLQNLINGERVKAPGAAELRALAAGLRLNVRLLQDAAAAQYFDRDAVYTPDERVRTMIYHFEELSEEDQVKVLRLMESWKNT